MSVNLLQGVRVLDLSRILAGPWSTQCLSDMGADVVKVERPIHGDETRNWGPPYLFDKMSADVTDATPDRSAYFIAANRGKRSIALDFSLPQERACLLQLIEKADVLVENFLPNVLQKYDLEIASLRARFPRLIIASIRGYAENTGASDQAAFDAMMQARGGLMHITGSADGEPHKVGVAVVDLAAGLYCAQAICAALFARSQTNQGTHIEINLFDTSLALLANQASNYLIGGRDPSRAGNAHPNIVPYQSFVVGTRHLMIAAGTDAQFFALARVLNHPEWIDDRRFCNNSARVTHRNELVLQIGESLQGATVEQWVATFQAANIPCSPVQSVVEALNDPITRAGDLIGEIAEGNSVWPVVLAPIRINQKRAGNQTMPPKLDADRAAILSDWF